jgi:hypothetical protein
MCGSAGFVVTLHKVNCEVAEAMLVLLDGRARHQTLNLTIGAPGRPTTEASWVCRGSGSVMGPIHCSQGVRFFTFESKSP